MKTMAILIGFLIWVSLSVGEASGQVGDFNLKPSLDGFTGEYNSGKQKLLVDYRVSNSKRFVSRILNSSGQTIVEAIQVPGSVTVSVAGVTLTVYINRSDAKNNGNSELSHTDLRKLKEFISSDDATAVRAVLANIIRQKPNDDKNQLMGFLTIAMLLGDEPQRIALERSNRDCGTPKFAYASYTVASSQMDIQSVFPAVTKSTTNDCHGCCGPGCWGCTVVTLRPVSTMTLV